MDASFVRLRHPALRPGMLLATAFLTAIALSGCGGGDPSPTDNGGGGGGGGSGPVATTSVNVQDNVFSPAGIRVSQGATVTWTWTGSQPHNVIWVGSALPASPTQTSGTHQAQMPNSGGELVYYCTIHGTPTAGMRGTVLVE